MELGQPDSVVRLGPEIMALGMEQIGQSDDEGETAEALGECMPVIFQALAASTLAPARKLLFAIDAQLQDDYNVVGEAANMVLEMPVEQAAWSEAADLLAQRLKTPLQEGGSFHHKYQRQQLADPYTEQSRAWRRRSGGLRARGARNGQL